MIKNTLAAVLCAGLMGCTIPYPKSPIGFTEKTIETTYLQFQVWEKITTPGAPIRFYIEGSGYPTPSTPVALKLAAKDPYPNVISVSQACQYVMCAECQNPSLWQAERFNPEMITEMKKMIQYLALKYQAPSIELVGYDSGATIALLLATQIPVSRIITVGGILDTYYSGTQEGIHYTGDNPMRLLNNYPTLPQVHYIAPNDTKAPKSVVEAFVSNQYKPTSAVIKIVPTATHTQWDDLVIE